MKFKNILVVLPLIIFILCSCSSLGTTTVTDLTNNDYKYIDLVYDNMSRWDKAVYDSGENHSINKITFYDFDGTGRLSFYKNYPIAGYYG